MICPHIEFASILARRSNHGPSVSLLCRDLGAQCQGFHSKQPHIAAPHHCLFIPLHPTWQRERERGRQTSRERERLLAVNPGLAGFSWTAVSNKVSRLGKKKKKNGVLHNNPAQRERQQRRKRGMNDGEILLKSLNDRSQFLLTRRKRYK